MDLEDVNGWKDEEKEELTATIKHKTKRTILYASISVHPSILVAVVGPVVQARPLCSSPFLDKSLVFMEVSLLIVKSPMPLVKSIGFRT
jgi:hypothetical protein